MSTNRLSLLNGGKLPEIRIWVNIQAKPRNLSILAFGRQLTEHGNFGRASGKPIAVEIRGFFMVGKAQSLTDTNWKPLGIMMEADTTLGEVKGGLQAPHVIQKDGMYYMLYGGWAQICLAKSSDGKHFERVINDKGTTEIFSGPFYNTRDAMTIKVGDKYYCYNTGHLAESKPGEIEAAIFCRTSNDLLSWSEPEMVSAGGSPANMDNWYGGDAECPFVVPIENKYVLFRNVRYGTNNINFQYCSDNPLNFGVNTDSLMVGNLAIAAPEIIKYEGEYYIFALKESLDGIRAANINFVKIKQSQNTD